LSEKPISTKELNHLRILNLLRIQPGISRIAIAKSTRLPKATVSGLVSDLIDDDLVVEAGAGVQLAAAGRRPVKLKLNGQIRLAIGVELTGSACVAALTDLYSEPIRVIREPMPNTSVQASIDMIIKTADDLLQGHDPTKVLGLAVGVPGPVDAERRCVIQAENIDWFDVPLASLLEERTNYPVTVVKRQQAGALGELWNGIGKGCSDLLYISIGVGIGCGIILSGRLWEGAYGVSGELGHMTIVPDGEQCRCGNFGCLETVASDRAIAELAAKEVRKGRETVLFDSRTGTPGPFTSTQVIAAAKAGDRLAIDVIQQAARYLGIGIASAANLFNPSKIVLGGDVVQLGDLFLAPIREVVTRRGFPLSVNRLEIVASSLGDRAAAIGAAALVIDRFFVMASPGKIQNSA
jgi:glucokinase-like ROK family protein